MRQSPLAVPFRVPADQIPPNFRGIFPCGLVPASPHPNVLHCLGNALMVGKELTPLRQARHREPHLAHLVGSLFRRQSTHLCQASFMSIQYVWVSISSRFLAIAIAATS